MTRPDFVGCYDICLYDFAQAEDLAGYLRRIGITDVETVPVHVQLEAGGRLRRKSSG